PVFLQFRGGRGILTGLGGILMMAPVAAAVATVTFLIITLVSRYVSLGSVVGVTIGCLFMVALTLVGMYSGVYAVYAVIGGAIIIWQHRDNIQRIRQGNERRLGNPARKAG
ncbi:MAG: glycerol-3-phosphate acyltransferase, partial [Chloroflexi bacterium]|nr:glycerol-3-phosphate acyltransferase [Chloroflexota bacterium]